MEFALGASYRNHLDLEYLCVDRILLRGYASILHTCGGFRTWAERLRPNEPVTQAWIQSLTRRFHRNVSKFAGERSIPIVKPKKGERRHQLADEFREEFDGDEGVYLIIKSFEKSRLFVSDEPREATDSNHRNLRRRDGFVATYYFYILDRHWGPMCVSICSHAPFNAVVLLNGHHWVARRASTRGIDVETETNAFLKTDDVDQLQGIADSLSERDIRSVADRWTYRVLPILTYKQRHDSRFRYRWSLSQLEVSHNLVFYPRFPVADLFQRHIDLTRRLLCPNSIATIFGKRRASGREDSSVSVYQTHASHSVLRIKHRNSVLKVYDKHRRILRTECVSNNSTSFGVGKLLINFAELRKRMISVIQQFQKLTNGILDSTLDRGELAALAQTSELGRARVPGIRLENERLMTVLQLLGHVATHPNGFTAGYLRELYSDQTGNSYSSSQASYNLRKLRAKSILTSVPKTRRYVLTSRGARLVAVLYKLRSLFLGPTLASSMDGPTPQPSKDPARSRRGPKPETVCVDDLERHLAQNAGNVTAVARDLGRQSCVVRRWIRRHNIQLEKFRKPVTRPEIEAAYQNIHEALDKLTRALELSPAA